MSIHYYSQELKQNLHRISEVRTILVEAPSGYGKTTAVKDYLNTREEMGAEIFWFTAMEETFSSSWSRVCNVLEKIDPVGGRNLIDIGVPTRITIGQVAEALFQLRCSRETYFVLDDFHLLDKGINENLLKAIFFHGGEQLHLIIIGQVFTRRTTRLMNQLSLNVISQENLILNPDNIQEFYRQSGASDITTEQAKLLFQKTGGWIIALCLQLKKFQETGTLAIEATGDILQLMQNLEWDDLDEECKRFLVLISPFDSVTVSQIRFMMDEPDIPKKIWDFLEYSHFIRYEPQVERYFPHVILLNLVRRKLSSIPGNLKIECLTRAGRWYESQRMQEEALHCFYQIKDWESILKLPNIGLSLSRVGDKRYVQIVQELLQGCPREVKWHYPITMLRFLYVFFGEGQFELYEKLLEETYHMVKAAPPEEQDWLLGEWTMMSAYADYPNLDKMTKTYRKAAELLKGRRSQVLSREEPYGFGCPSLWYIFHSEIGKADEIGDQLEQMLDIYSEMTGGRGNGADALYRGEVACMRGDFIRAEILAHKAAEAGAQYRQITICFGSALLLGRIALSRNDRELLDYSISYFERKVNFFDKIQPTQMCNRMQEVVRSMLYSMMEEQEKGADWALDGQLDKGLMAISAFVAGHVYITHLVSNKEYTKAIGLMEYMLSCDSRICNLVARHYIYLGLTICYLAIGQEQRAMEFMSKELECAFPDGICVNILRFLPSLDRLENQPTIHQTYGKWLEKLHKMRLAYAVDEKSVYYVETERLNEKHPDDLTAREREVAELVADGHSNHEIAELLCISETTVKYHLRMIFSKMQIDRRSKLIKKLSF
ncbi:MAG: LuxR C-terminal-related transcriptional regulator [Clostridium sp.]